MTYRITGIDVASFRHLYGLDAAALAAQSARRVHVDAPNCTPDRVELRDLMPGETALLVNYLHQPAATPYRASHAIFVREGAEAAAVFEDEVPAVMSRRPQSIWAFDAEHEVVYADLAEGSAIALLIRRRLGRGDVAYLQAHYARRECFAATITRG